MSAPVSHQTVRLARGRHRSPADGVCAMELASMLAGERFSDRPRSVSRVVGAFVRTYNDLVDDERRQDLYAYAAEVVGTAGDREVEQQRAELCRAFLERYETIPPGPLSRTWLAGHGRGERLANRAAMASVPNGRPRHRVALTLLDALIACGRQQGARPSPVEAQPPEPAFPARAGG